MPDAAEAQMMLLLLYYQGVYLMRKTLFAITMVSITMTMDAAHSMTDFTVIAVMKAVTVIPENTIL